MIPKPELTGLVNAVMDAEQAASQDKPVDGYEALIAGLRRAETAKELGDDWAPDYDEVKRVNHFPATKLLPKDWYILQGAQDQVCRPDAVRRFAAAVSKAHVIDVNGLGLDAWAGKLLRGARANAVTLSDGIDTLDGGNPHLWFDVHLAERYVDRMESLATRVGALLEPALILCVGGCIFFVVLGLFMPLIMVLRNLTSGGG